ncbi:MAG: carbohydrate ABC transporter permease [Spirochaetia bacterium]
MNNRRIGLAGRRGFRRILPRIIITAVMALVALTCLSPLLWMVSASFKFESDVFSFPVQWLPERWNAVENYREVWTGTSNFALYYWNSIKVAVLSTMLLLLTASMAAYAFTKIKFRGREILFWIYLAAMMIPMQVTLVPKFMIARWFGIYDTHFVLIVMGAFSAFAVFLLKQNMDMIPSSLTESAQIDGANHFRIYLNIIIPIIKPVLAIQGILKFVWTWNNYQMPLIFLKSKELYTIQLGLAEFADESGVYYSLVMAGSVSAILPLIIIFLIGQRYILKGITVGSVKG